MWHPAAQTAQGYHGQPPAARQDLGASASISQQVVGDLFKRRGRFCRRRKRWLAARTRASPSIASGRQSCPSEMVKCKILLHVASKACDSSAANAGEKLFLPRAWSLVLRPSDPHGERGVPWLLGEPRPATLETAAAVFRPKVVLQLRAQTHDFRKYGRDLL